MLAICARGVALALRESACGVELDADGSVVSAEVSVEPVPILGAVALIAYELAAHWLG